MIVETLAMVELMDAYLVLREAEEATPGPVESVLSGPSYDRSVGLFEAFRENIENINENWFERSREAPTRLQVISTVVAIARTKSTDEAKIVVLMAQGYLWLEANRTETS
jgi:hypothetical protein